MNTTILAIDAATSRLTVALAHGGQLDEHHVDGPRRHANEILTLVDELLAAHRLGPRQVEQVITGDGPGSFTGLRVAASVAKALVWGRADISWATAPSLMVRALAASRTVSKSPVAVLALSDALRGELYAGCWRFDGGSATTIGAEPRAMLPTELRQFGTVDAVIGTIPDNLLATVRDVTGVEPISGDAALPDARDLIRLAGIAGGVSVITDRAGWHPVYGRPAEAQAVWERKFGKPLPDQSYHSG